MIDEVDNNDDGDGDDSVDEEQNNPAQQMRRGQQRHDGYVDEMLSWMKWQWQNR